TTTARATRGSTPTRCRRTRAWTPRRARRCSPAGWSRAAPTCAPWRTTTASGLRQGSPKQSTTVAATSASGACDGRRPRPGDHAPSLLHPLWVRRYHLLSPHNPVVIRRAAVGGRGRKTLGQKTLVDTITRPALHFAVPEPPRYHVPRPRLLDA